jgi:hypothetical protein
VSIEDQSEKTCAICGRDCSGQPRIRDPKGRYFHKTCYEQALEERKMQQAAEHEAEPEADVQPPPMTAGPPRPASPPESPAPAAEAPFESPAEAPADDAALFALEADSSQALPPEAAPPTMPESEPGGAAFACPSCGAEMGPGAIICTSCGYNAQTGRQVESTGDEARPAVSAVETGRVVWPTIVGVISIVLGGGGAVVYGGSIVMVILRGSLSWPSGVTIVAMGLAIWLLLAGIGVIRRQQTAAVSMRRWAITKTVLCAVGFVVVLALTILAEDITDTITETLGTDVATLGMATFYILLLAMLLWTILWPVFVLVWFSRASIQEQIGRWH